MRAFTKFDYEVTFREVEKDEHWVVYVDGSEFCHLMKYLGEYNAWNELTERDGKTPRQAVSKLMEVLV